jgi:SAM-dependent methyltransferase
MANEVYLARGGILLLDEVERITTKGLEVIYKALVALRPGERPFVFAVIDTGRGPRAPKPLPAWIWRLPLFDAEQALRAFPQRQENPPTAIDPSRTAIGRRGPSRPVRELERAGLLEGRILDFGAGRGSDVAWLRRKGYDAQGYDLGQPRPRGLFDRVVASYVANVVPGPDRAEVLEDAWSFVRPGGLLLIASRTPGDVAAAAARGSFEPCWDGWCSSRGTFQRGLSQGELAELAADLPGAAPLPLAPRGGGFSSVAVEKRQRRP